MSTACCTPLWKSTPVRLFTSVSLIQFICVAICSIVMFVLSFNVSYEEPTKMKAYSIIFFVSAFMFEYFAIDALYFEDAFELVVFLISSCVILGMSVYRFFFSDWGTPTPDLWVLLIVSAIALILYAILVPIIYVRFGWTVSQAVGADAKLQRCYVNLRAFIASLKLAVYFQAIFSILVGFYFSLTYELIGIVVVVLIEAGWAILGWYAFSREKLRLAIVWYCLSPLTPAYLIYIIYKLCEMMSRLQNFPAWQGFAIAGGALVTRIIALILALRSHPLLLHSGTSLWSTRVFMRIQNDEAA